MKPQRHRPLKKLEADYRKAWADLGRLHQEKCELREQRRLHPELWRELALALLKNRRERWEAASRCNFFKRLYAERARGRVVQR